MRFPAARMLQACWTCPCDRTQLELSTVVWLTTFDNWEFAGLIMVFCLQHGRFEVIFILHDSLHLKTRVVRDGASTVQRGAGCSRSGRSRKLQLHDLFLSWHQIRRVCTISILHYRARVLVPHKVVLCFATTPVHYSFLRLRTRWLLGFLLIHVYAFGFAFSTRCYCHVCLH